MNRVRLMVVLVFPFLAGAAVAQQDPVREAFDRLLTAAEKDDRANGEQAFQEVRALGAAALPQCRARLKSATVLHRQIAIMIIGEMGPSAAPALPDVVAATRDADASVRGAAAVVLADLDRGPATISRLTELLRDPAPVVRWNSAMSLNKFGPEAASAVPALVAALEDEDDNVFSYAMGALKRIKARPELCVPALTKALARNFWAGEALAEFGENARPAMPALVARLNAQAAKAEPNDMWVHSLAVAIEKIGGPEAKAALPAVEAAVGRMTSVNFREDLQRVAASLKGPQSSR